MTKSKVSPCIFCHTETPIKGEGLCWLCKHENYTKKRLIKKAQQENNTNSIIIKLRF